METTLIAD